MKILNLVLLVFLLSIALRQGGSSGLQNVSTVNLHCNCGSFITEVLPYVKGLLSEIKAISQETRIIPKTHGKTYNPMSTID